MSLKKLAQGFKSNGACENRAQAVRVESRVHTDYTTRPRHNYNELTSLFSTIPASMAFSSS